MIALDASALLAYMFREPGHTVVADVLEECCLSSVNLAEVLARFTRDGHDAWGVLGRIGETAIELVDFRPRDAALAAALVPRARPLGLSFGDRACLALAIARHVPAVTADHAWTQVDWGVEIRLIR